jgi:hypothetical protein
MVKRTSPLLQVQERILAQEKRQEWLIKAVSDMSKAFALAKR